MITKNQEFELRITDMSAEGSGIGHHDGEAVFVPHTAVGDLILCHIVKTKKTYAFGKALDILEPSADRIEPDCDVSSQCGGCCYRHMTYEAELRVKQKRVEDAMQRLARIDTDVLPILGSEKQVSYRNKAQYPVQAGGAKGLQIGFYGLHSHRIVPCMDCLLQPALFYDVLTILRDWILRYKIPIYDEQRHKGLLRHIYLRRGAHTGELMVCLVINGTNVPHAFQLTETLKADLPDFKTLVVNYNTADTNVILGEDCETLYGDGFIRDTMLGISFRVSPLSFYQVNTPQAERLYQIAADFAQLTPEDTLLDLYCGIGTIGLTMADKVRQVYGVEVIPDAVLDAKRNAKENDIENAEFFCGDAAAAAVRLRSKGIQPDVIVVDPPRKGLDPVLIGTIADMAPSRVVYVSCDPGTLARDCARFAEQGYIARKIQPVDLFPRTAHVETVVLMTGNK